MAGKPPYAPLRPMDVASRIEKFREHFQEWAVDAALVTNLTNISYLTGFTGSAAMLAITRDKVTFTTDGRYGIQSEAELSESGALSRHKIEITVGGLVAQKGALVGQLADQAKIGLEADTVTWSQLDAFRARWFDGQDLVALSGAVEGLRRHKDAGEIDRIARACAIADDALSAIAPSLKDGPTEKEFAMALDAEMRRLGADDVSFDTIVAAGTNGAKAHHQPSDHQIAPGELVVIDFGALVDGYHSDMTRTLCVGQPSTDTRQKMFDVVFDSQARGVEAVKSGVTCGAVDEVCREAIKAHGWADAFSHSTGHGVGLDIHEAPAVANGVADTLTPGQVVTVEPGVYLAEHGGVRIEDTVVVTENGCQVLTNAPKELVIA